MKNVLICASLLGSMLTFAQEKDTLKSSNIEEVVVNGKYYKNMLKRKDHLLYA